MIAVIHPVWSGGGPGEGFLGNTCWRHGEEFCGKLQMLEDRPAHLALCDGRDELQRPPLSDIGG